MSGGVPPAPRTGWLTAALAAVLLAGCATPTAPPATPVRAALPVAQDPLEQQYRERALAAIKDRRWADARVQWQLLVLLRPGVPEYRTQLEQTERRIAELAAEALKAGEAARRRGDAEQAQTHYLRVLALDPDQPDAMQALRELERDRVRRAYFNRAPRNVLAPGIAPRNGAASAQTLPGAEIGVVLHRQGDYAGAIQALTRHLQAHPGDDAARELLADANYNVGIAYAQQGKHEDALIYLDRARSQGHRDAAAVNAALRQSRRALADDYVRQAAQLPSSERLKAIALWEQALKIDPTHPEALVRLRQARPSTPRQATRDQ